MTARLIVEVEQALGPGVDFEHERGAGLVGRHSRSGGAWLGFDRAALVDSDDGGGRRMPVLVCLPTSTFVGARLEVVVSGCWSSPEGSVLVASIPGAPPPVPALARIAGEVDGRATWLDSEAGHAEARRARQRYRERASHDRIIGGRAWHSFGELSPEIARLATPHSAAEYRLSHLPARYLRGLDGLLDDDERVLYWIERPTLTDVSIVRRIRERRDRRGALFALTDKQVLWMVDHTQPDRHLSDWGVDVSLVPVERVVGARCARRREHVEITIDTRGGARRHAFPPELGEEVSVMRALLDRFTPAAAGSLPRRRYAIEPVTFAPETAAPFGQEAEARALVETAGRTGDVLAFLYSPRRPGQRTPAAIVLRSTAVERTGATGGRVGLDDVAAITLTLSPLVGRLSFGPIDLTYPAPLVEAGAAFARAARRVIANLA